MVNMTGPADEPQWRPLAGIDPLPFKDARLQAHHALQWLARVARAHIPPQADDGHTCLHWDSGLDAFMTQAFAGGARLGLHIPTLTLALHGDRGAGAAQTLTLDGHTDAQVYQWLHQQFDAHGLDASMLDAPAPYEIPMHAIGNGSAYDVRAAAGELANLAAWYANAAVLIEDVRMQAARRCLAVSAPCCWPHHFDLAILTMVPADRSAEVGLIGVGLSPGDEYYEEPYFYVSIYPDPSQSALPSLPTIGGWHTHDFTAAVATAHDILAAQHPAIETSNFLRDAVAASLSLLGQSAQD